MQVKVVTTPLVDEGTGPVMESHWETCPLTIQLTNPVGLAAPVTPVITAVKVSGLPKVGLTGKEEVTIVGIAAPTTIETGDAVALA